MVSPHFELEAEEVGPPFSEGVDDRKKLFFMYWVIQFCSLKRSGFISDRSSQFARRAEREHGAAAKVAGIQTKSCAWHGIFRFLFPRRFGSTQSTMSSSITVFAICLGCLGCCGVRWNAVSLDAKPTKMRHLCKNMLKAVQNTTTRVSNILSNVCICCPVPHPFPTQSHTFLQSQDHSVYSLLKTSVQNTTIRLLTIIVRVIGISMHSLSGTTPFPMATSAASISLNPRLPLSP